MTRTPLTRRAESPGPSESGVRAQLLHAGNPNDERGAELWDFIVSFVAARRTFLSLYRRYEERVLGSSKRLRVRREDLVLPPQDLFKLFNMRRLSFLRDARLRPLRDLAEQIFALSGDEELLDVYCSHIYHEFSILRDDKSVPSGSRITNTDRRRCKSVPTYRDTSGLPSRGEHRQPEVSGNRQRGAEARSLIASPM